MPMYFSMKYLKIYVVFVKLEHLLDGHHVATVYCVMEHGEPVLILRCSRYFFYKQYVLYSTLHNNTPFIVPKDM
jgi:hypothetical protein